ncbi:MAG: IS5/IS1182 family transposase, partial [Sphingomonadaceae bacterium]|nr:IS5/IS1182 family transposase [Sphingomonadaceae bacterium]
MAVKRVGERGFADDLLGGRLGSNAVLERIAGLIDWGSIEAFLAGLHSSRYGRPAYPPLVLFKALLL